MPISFRKQGIILLILVACALCVAPVLADSPIPENLLSDSYTYTPDFNKTIAVKYTTKIDGNYYLNKHVDTDFINAYIKAQKSYIMSHLDLCVVLNIPDHGWFNNNEIVAECYWDRNISEKYEGDTLIASYVDTMTNKTRSYYIHTNLIDALKYEMYKNDFKWIDVQDDIGKSGFHHFVNLIYGQNYKP